MFVKIKPFIILFGFSILASIMWIIGIMLFVLLYGLASKDVQSYILIGILILAFVVDLFGLSGISISFSNGPLTKINIFINNKNINETKT